jgi:hypothetical protein
MIAHIHHIVHDEQRPFSYLDFLAFEVDGQEYRTAHGTFRNIISLLTKEGLVEVSYKSSIAFYSLRGVRFDKASRNVMTDNHAGGAHITSSNPLYRLIRDLPLGRNSIHDIHLKFTCPRIYTVVSLAISNEALGYSYKVNPTSRDISILNWILEGLQFRITIHMTDIVSVVIGCSLAPVILDVNGVIRLTSAMSAVKERLSQIVEGPFGAREFGTTERTENSSQAKQSRATAIPAYSQWMVTMWHFGVDALIEYSGERFCVTWETAENTLVRAYSKVAKDRMPRIRLERQEYPRSTLADVIEQKLSPDRRFT